jgi:tRNA (cytidine/uridine-2'-O-)-methyltransferase
MLHIALWEPAIPPNTGNIARLCAATGSELHLIGRLGFRLDNRSLRRAGIDYWDKVVVHRHVDLDTFEKALPAVRLICFSAHATRPYTHVAYRPNDCLLFGSEAHGLPQSVLRRCGENVVTIPMPALAVRSLNLATAVAIALYEALRQIQEW